MKKPTTEREIIMEIEYQRESNLIQSPPTTFYNSTKSQETQQMMLEETQEESFQNLIVPIPRYKCKRLEQKPQSLSLNDEIMLGVRAKRVLQFAEESGLLKFPKLEEQTKATNSSCEEKEGPLERSFDIEDLYGEEFYNDGSSSRSYDAEISPVRRRKMLEILKKFKKDKEKKTKALIENFYSGGVSSKNMSIELQLLLGRSKAVNRMADNNLDKLHDLLFEVQKTTAKINGEKF